MDKTAFYWAVIGNANPEPVAVVVGEDGKRLAYTIGCPDPFEIDVPEPNIELLRPQDLEPIWNEKDRTHYYVAQGYLVAEPQPMKIPEKVLLPELEKRREEAEERLRQSKKRHSWKRLNP